MLKMKFYVRMYPRYILEVMNITVNNGTISDHQGLCETN
jgi:hypothetical protein